MSAASPDSRIELVADQDAQRAAGAASGKIRPLDDLAAIAAAAREAGEQVVLAHGVFDLVHLGHVRHLTSARREGSVLIVTLTADAHVNKGPGRPVFPETQRAEMLAALQCVDWVGVNHAASAVPVIEAIRPHAYVKGPDYANAEDDITGKIDAEREAVEAAGGRLVVTDDIVFSSSSLINRYSDIYEPALRDYLAAERERGTAKAISELIERARDMRVLMIGETIIDDYQYVVPIGKSPKENMIATSFRDREVFAGGVIAAANHVASFCREVEVLSCIGTTESYADLIQNSLAPNVKVTFIERTDAPTTRKCRFIDPGYLNKLFEVYFFDDTPIDGVLESSFQAVIRDRMRHCDLVTVTDFGHGLITGRTVDLLTEEAPFLAVNCQSNSANMGYNLITKYPRADFICIDAPEARLATGNKAGPVDQVITEGLVGRIDCPNIIVTHGKNGCYAYRRGESAEHLPALASSVTDTVGAGDAFFSVAAPLVASGGDLSHVAFTGNAAGAMKVGIVGHRRCVDKISLLKFVEALLK